MNLTPLDKAALEAEYDLIVKTLKKTKFNKSKAAELLQIDRKTLYNKITAYENLMASCSAVQEPISTTH
jgi:two-component system response regulator HydG